MKKSLKIEHLSNTTVSLNSFSSSSETNETNNDNSSDSVCIFDSSFSLCQKEFYLKNHIFMTS